MNLVSRHLSRYPNARPSTLRELQIRQAKLEQLQAELEQAKKPKTRLAEIVRKLNELIGWKG